MDKERIEDFMRWVSRNPYIGVQEECGKGKDYWNADMWTMEVCLCLIFEDEYKKTKIYKKNKNYNIERIKKDAEIKRNMYYNLQKFQNDCDCLLIGEVGRGLDVVIANMIKPWKTVYCYDQVYYEHYIIEPNIEFFQTSTDGFDPSLAEDSIMIINGSRHTEKFLCEKFDKMKHMIIDGEIIW